MADRQPLTDKERAELVAYLDGELHGAAARAMEARLNLYPEVRAEAESLRRAWDMLDFLPRPEASPHFTERTISRILPVPGAEIRTPPPQSFVVPILWAAAVVTAFLGGWAAYEWLIPHEPGERELVQDLRIIENFRLYEQADDIDFVRQLDQSELFRDEVGGS
jgi:anti-sigma factor RsiW